MHSKDMVINMNEKRLAALPAENDKLRKENHTLKRKLAGLVLLQEKQRAAEETMLELNTLIAETKAVKKEYEELVKIIKSNNAKKEKTLRSYFHSLEKIIN